MLGNMYVHIFTKLYFYFLKILGIILCSEHVYFLNAQHKSNLEDYFLFTLRIYQKLKHSDILQAVKTTYHEYDLVIKGMNF